MSLSRILDKLKDGSRRKLRIDYGDPKQPEKPIAWLWRFIVCRASDYAEPAYRSSRVACSSRGLIGDLLGITTPLMGYDAAAFR